MSLGNSYYRNHRKSKDSIHTLRCLGVVSGVTCDHPLSCLLKLFMVKPLAQHKAHPTVDCIMPAIRHQSLGSAGASVTTTAKLARL